MTTVAAVKICASCKGELPQVIPQYCPHCGSEETWLRESRRRDNELSSKQKWTFTSIHRQYKISLAELNNIKDVDSYANRGQAEIELRNQLKSAYRYLPKEEKFGVLTDCIQIMMQVMHSNLPADDIGQMIKLGKKIGEIANAAEGFVKALGFVPKD